MSQQTSHDIENHHAGYLQARGCLADRNSTDVTVWFGVSHRHDDPPFTMHLNHFESHELDELIDPLLGEWGCVLIRHGAMPGCLGVGLCETVLVVRSGMPRVLAQHEVTTEMQTRLDAALSAVQWTGEIRRARWIAAWGY